MYLKKPKTENFQTNGEIPYKGIKEFNKRERHCINKKQQLLLYN